MFNIQPGMGLGYQANKQMALGLGYALVDVTVPVIFRDIEGGEAGMADDHRLLIIRDDEEIIGIITTIVTSGIL